MWWNWNVSRRAIGVSLSLAAFASVPVAQAAEPRAPVVQEGQAGRLENTPQALDGVGVDEHLGQQLPINLSFFDAQGERQSLHQILQGSRPALLTFNYADCPMLCNLQLDGLAEGLGGVGLVPGKDFDVVTVSINPNERAEKTKAFAKKYHDKVGGEAIAKGWHFLRTDGDSAETLARAAGFAYNYVAEQKEYAHTAVAILLAPDAMITRYIYGVTYNPRDLRLALVEAAKGEVGSTLDRILLYCFHYDASTGKYAPLASNIMRLGGALTATALAAFLLLAWRRDRPSP